MSESLSAAVVELVAALNGGDADTARAWCTEAAWERGPVPIEPLCRDEFLTFEAAPSLLESDQRGAARLMGTREDKTRESLWLLFDQRADGWWCVEATRTRLDAEGFLTGRRPVGDRQAGPVATPNPLASVGQMALPFDAALQGTVERLVAALETGDADAGRALTEEGHWDSRGESPSRLFRHVARTPSDVTLLEWRIRGERAAIRVALSAAWGAEDVWTVWRHRRGLGWKLVSAPAAWEQAGLFVIGLVDEVPMWASLTADAGAARWGQAIVAASRDGGSAPDGVPAAAFAVLGRAPASASHELRVGETVSLPAIGRAMVRFDVVDPADDYEVESRWAVLERSSPEGRWRFRGVAGMGSLVGLLEGIAVPWHVPGEVAPTVEADEGARRAVLLAVREVLVANHLDPEELGVDQMTREQLQTLLPEVVGKAFGAMFATAIGRILEDVVAAEAPEGTVDLDAERARRAAPENEFEQEIAGQVRRVIGGATRGEIDPFTEAAPRILGSLFGAVAKAVGPANVTIDVPVKDGEKTEAMKLEIPLGEILGQMFAAASKKPEK